MTIRRTAHIIDRNLFALHYIPKRNARSTVQTEQAMPERAWGWATHKWQQNVNIIHLRDSGMFRRCFFIPFYGIYDLNGVP